MTITKFTLKQEIDRLDEHYLELVYNILRQFPSNQKLSCKIDPLLHSHPIRYAILEMGEGQVFTEVENAADYGKQLRISAWQRNKHD